MTHVLPATDGFTATAPTPSYNTAHEGYTCFVPSGATTIGVYASSGWAVGKMHDGYSVFNTSTGPYNKLYGEQVNCCMTGSAAVDLAVGWVHREIASASDAEVSILTNVHRPSSGAADRDMLRIVGVFARAQGGTVVNPSSATHAINDGDCYAFGVWNDSSNNALYQLLRINAGVVTVLQTGDETGTNPGTAFDVFGPGLPFNLPWVLRLEVSDESGNVRLRGYREHTGPVLVDPDLETFNSLKVIDYLDTSGSRISTAGRFGFFASRENTVSSVKSIQLVHWFKVEIAGTVQLLDEFRRADRSLAEAVTPASGYAAGIDLASLWSGDYHGLSGHGGRLRVSTPVGLTDRAMIDPAVATAGTVGDETSAAYMQYQRPSSNKFEQSMSASFRISTNDASGAAGVTITPRIVGLWCRGALLTTSAVALQTGYSLHIRGGLATIAFVKVRRWVGGVSTVIAEETVTTAFATGVDHDVSFAVFNIEDAQGNQSNGDVQISVSVDSVPVVLTIPSGVSNVTAFPDGSVVDSDGARILAGTSEGVLVLCPGGTNVVYVDDFSTSGAFSGASAGNDEATIAVSNEITSLSGTLTVPYDWPVEDVTDAYSISKEYEDGYRASRAQYQTARRVWEITMGACTLTERDALITFWDAHKAGEVAFNWTPKLETTAVHAIFLGDELEYAKRAINVHGYRFRIMQVFP